MLILCGDILVARLSSVLRLTMPTKLSNGMARGRERGPLKMFRPNYFISETGISFHYVHSAANNTGWRTKPNVKLLRYFNAH